ncbi:hypothetical protein BT69DRAFT_1034825 [Atractiella rhizophila]|nr:hypothetical protein BT69DRAFT_1034825 [Atractiella rhizophila]
MKVKKTLNHPLVGEMDDGDEGRGGDVERWDSPRKRRRGDVVKNGLREMAQQIITQANSRHALWHSSLSRSLSSHSPHLPLSLSALDPAPSFVIQIKRLLHSPKTSKTAPLRLLASLPIPISHRIPLALSPLYRPCECNCDCRCSEFQPPPLKGRRRRRWRWR